MVFNKIFINEKLFFVFLIFLWLCLAVSGALLSISAMALLGILAFSLWIYFGRETHIKNILKLWIPPVSVPILYSIVGQVVLTLKISKKDQILQVIDQLLINKNMSIKLQPFVNPFLTEAMYLIYMLFFYYIISTLIHYAKRRDSVTKSFYEGLFSIYWIGFFLYVLVPAEGPYLDMAASFGAPLKEGLLYSGPIYEMIYAGTNRTDVFPSLHCAISAYCLLFDRIHRRRRFNRSLVFCVLIWVSTIYLRYHYFIDVLSGMALTLFALYLAKRSSDQPMVLSHH